jgi:hypothetical protein
MGLSALRHCGGKSKKRVSEKAWVKQIAQLFEVLEVANSAATLVHSAAVLPRSPRKQYLSESLLRSCHGNSGGRPVAQIVVHG